MTMGVSEPYRIFIHMAGHMTSVLPYIRISSLPSSWRVVSWELANSPQVPFIIFSRGLKFSRLQGQLLISLFVFQFPSL